MLLRSLPCALLVTLAAACGPRPAPAGNAPLAGWKLECDTFYDVADRFVACEKADPEVRQAVSENVGNHKANLASYDLKSAPPDAKQQLASECRQHANTLREDLHRLGC